MRIGVDIRCLMDGRRTGVEEYTLHLLRAMVAVSPTDTFALFANSRRPMRLPRFPEPNVEVRTFAYPNAAFNASVKYLRRPRIDQLLGGLDVFFAPAVRLTALSFACPLVLTLHDLSFARHPEFFSPDRRRWHRLMEPAAAAFRAARIITVSAATAADVAELYGVPSARVEVIHSGIATTMTPDGADAARRSLVQRRYGLPPRFLLFLGTLEPRKNLPALLAAYAAVRRAGFPHALVLAGLRGWVDDAFFRELLRHPYAADIRRTGYVEDADKPALYQLADLFVYPSLYEGFGFPPLEALACGTPVVTSFNSAIPEVAGPWAALVNPSDPEELAEVLIDRLRHPASVPLVVSAEIRQRYSWDHAARATLAVLRRAAAQSRVASRSHDSRLMNRHAHRH